MKPEAKILAAKIFLAMALSTGPVMMAPAQAGGIPVIDVGKLTQNVMTAMESVGQTLKQIEPYRRNCSSTKTCCGIPLRRPPTSGIRRSTR